VLPHQEERGVRDGDFDQIAMIDRGYRRCAEDILTPELRDVAVEFSTNVERVVAACLLPSFFAISIASLLDRHGASSGREPPMAAHRVAKRLKGDVSEDRLRIASQHLVATASAENNNRVEIALGQILPNAVIGIWTAFDVLASSLWIRAFDCFPVAFKTLDGSQNRIESRTPPLRKLAVPQRSFSGNQRKLQAGAATSTGEQLASSGFLPGFASLTSIRKSYGMLFSELHRIRATCAIDAAIANKQLEFIGLTRHVLVHKAGIVDSIHYRKSKTIRGCPRFHVGQPVPLDGRFTKAIIAHVIT
jgi:hypothetical protein